MTMTIPTGHATAPRLPALPRPSRNRNRNLNGNLSRFRGQVPVLLPRLLVGLGLALLPWLVVLATTLPATATASHWPLAWVGLDCLEAVGLISTGVLLRRGDPRRCLTAVATSVLLLCDAWFDVTTSAPGADFATSVAMAVGVELPLALLCVRLALRALPRG
jgi:hypothetical protein